jgi:hypothetical protein
MFRTVFRRLTFLGASSLLGGIALLLRYKFSITSQIWTKLIPFSAVPCILVLYGPRIRARSAIAKVNRYRSTFLRLLLTNVPDSGLDVDVEMGPAPTKAIPFLVRTLISI